MDQSNTLLAFKICVNDVSSDLTVYIFTVTYSKFRMIVLQESLKFKKNPDLNNSNFKAFSIHFNPLCTNYFFLLV